MRRIFSIGIVSIGMVASLTGCVVGQSLKTNYQPAAASKVAAGGPVVIDVADNRPYVKSGEKSPYYVGKYRSGFGIPWDVTTQDKEPLADVLKRDLGKEVEALGFNVAEPASAARKISVSVEEWNFDGYQNGKFWYALDVNVTDANGKVLATSQLKDNKGITGNLWTGAKGGFERDMPKLHAEILRKLVRENRTVLDALRPSTAANH